VVISSLKLLVSLFFMKVAAIILLICFVGYFIETIKIPLSFSTTCSKVVTCSKMLKGGCMKRHKANDSRRSKSKECNTSCENCPCNCVTIFAFISPSNNSPITLKKLYSSPRNFTLQGYHADAWKPPDNGQA
jgi:hypothetical protein